MSSVTVPETMSDFREIVFGNPIGCDRKDALWGLHSNGRWYKVSTNRSAAPADYPVTPGHIKHTSFCGVFGRSECETFAKHLVKMAKAAGGWKPFSMQDIVTQVGEPWNVWTPENVVFFIQLGFLVGNDEEQRYYYTNGFIAEVYDSQRGW